MKFTVTSPKNTFITSDTHVGHENILKYCRGSFAGSVEEMNDFLTENWNRTVRPDDTVIILGDIVMGKRSESLEVVKQWNGKKYLVPGNHDCHPMFSNKKNFAAMVELYESAGLTIVSPFLEIECYGKTFDACHFPYDGDHTDEVRFEAWRPVNRGNWLLHGHVHGSGAAIGSDKQIDVGVDNQGYVPVSFDRILEETAMWDGIFDGT